jgi:hypothetical protein
LIGKQLYPVNCTESNICEFVAHLQFSTGSPFFRGLLAEQTYRSSGTGFCQYISKFLETPACPEARANGQPIGGFALNPPSTVDYPLFAIGKRFDFDVPQLSGFGTSFPICQRVCKKPMLPLTPTAQCSQASSRHGMNSGATSCA